MVQPSTKTMISTTRGRHPPRTAPARELHPVRRVRLLERAALHLSVALITRGRRPLEFESRERRIGEAEQYFARLERERAAERWVRLHLPLR